MVDDQCVVLFGSTHSSLPNCGHIGAEQCNEPVGQKRMFKKGWTSKDQKRHFGNCHRFTTGMLKERWNFNTRFTSKSYQSAPIFFLTIHNKLSFGSLLQYCKMKEPTAMFFPCNQNNVASWISLSLLSSEAQLTSTKNSFLTALNGFRSCSERSTNSTNIYV